MEILLRKVIEGKETIKQFKSIVELSNENIFTVRGEMFDLDTIEVVCINYNTYHNFGSFIIDKKELRRDIFETLEKCIKYNTGLKIFYHINEGNKELHLEVIE